VNCSARALQQHPGPASYGKQPGPPPSFDALPAESKLMMKALVWYMDRVLEAAPSNREQRVDGQVLTGIPASPGRYTGRVRLRRTSPSSAGCNPEMSWYVRSRRRCGRCCSPASELS
jgi:hypothetical protein